MSADEFSVEFNILWNNIDSNQSPGLNLLEKSAFLTQSKELIIKDLYSGNSGPFEANEEVTQYLQKLVKQVNYTINDGDVGGSQYNFDLQSDCWDIVYEQAAVKINGCKDTQYIYVTPTTHNEFGKMIDNPFRGPDRRTILRLVSGDEVQLFCSKDVKLVGYTMRYLKQPSKIYLKNFITGEAPKEWLWSESGIETEWDTYKSNVCPDLPESIHRAILIKAVQLAKAAWK